MWSEWPLGLVPFSFQHSTDPLARPIWINDCHSAFDDKHRFARINRSQLFMGIPRTRRVDVSTSWNVAIEQQSTSLSFDARPLLMLNSCFFFASRENSRVKKRKVAYQPWYSLGWCARDCRGRVECARAEWQTCSTVKTIENKKKKKNLKGNKAHLNLPKSRLRGPVRGRRYRICRNFCRWKWPELHCLFCRRKNSIYIPILSRLRIWLMSRYCALDYYYPQARSVKTIKCGWSAVRSTNLTQVKFSQCRIACLKRALWAPEKLASISYGMTPKSQMRSFRAVAARLARIFPVDRRDVPLVLRFFLLVFGLVFDLDLLVFLTLAWRDRFLSLDGLSDRPVSDTDESSSNNSSSRSFFFRCLNEKDGKRVERRWVKIKEIGQREWSRAIHSQLLILFQTRKGNWVSCILAIFSLDSPPPHSHLFWLTLSRLYSFFSFCALLLSFSCCLFLFLPSSLFWDDDAYLARTEKILPSQSTGGTREREGGSWMPSSRLKTLG